MAVLKRQAPLWPVFLVFILLYAGAFPAGAQPVFPAEGEKIPLLISDHHADHGPFMLRHFGTGPDKRVCMVVLDAHTDTVKNVSPDIVGNHDWISPLYPVPLETLVWIYTVADFPRPGKERGFYQSVSEWGAGDPPLNARVLSLSGIPLAALSASAGLSLFVSIDLDFFSIENNTPADIPYVFDVLFDFASQWQGKVVYAVALSRPWLPDDGYAWELLRQSLRWFSGKTEFASPGITLFSVQRKDSSAKARAYRETGLAVPSFYGKENEMPEDVRDLLVKLKK
jgi:hypothetical protein